MKELSNRSRKLLERLLRSEFDRLHFPNDPDQSESLKIIKTAKQLGLKELAQQMKNDLD